MAKNTSEPTYGGRPLPAGSRVDEFHVSDQQLADMKKRLPVEGAKKSDPEPLHVSYARINGKSVNDFSHSDLTLADATNAMDKREGKAVPKENEVTQGQLTEASERETTKSGKISAAKEVLEKGARSPKVAPNVPKPSKNYVWDSKADKMGTRGKRGEVTHLSEDEDNEIRAGLTAAADAKEGGQNRKFATSTTDWQGKPADRADVEEAAASRFQRGPVTSAHNVTGQNVTTPGTNRPAGKAGRAAANAQARYDKTVHTAPVGPSLTPAWEEPEHPDVLAKEAHLAGTTLADPKFKSAGHLSEARTRARVVVHGGVSEDAAKNLKGEGLQGVHDLIMGKKRFEEGRMGSGKEYTFSHENGGIGATDTFETGNKINGVNEERPVPIGHTFKRSTNELPKGSGELVTSNAPGSDYTAGEVRPLSGFEGWTRTPRRAADGTTRHVWTENKLPKDIVHASDTVVEHINKYKRISPKMATKDRLANRAEADVQNAAAGETETYGLDTRNLRRRGRSASAPVASDSTASRQGHAAIAGGLAKTFARTADKGYVKDFGKADVDRALATQSSDDLDNALSGKAVAGDVPGFGAYQEVLPKAVNVARGKAPKADVKRPSKSKVMVSTTDPVEPTPAQAPGSGIPMPASAKYKARPSRQFTGKTVPGTEETARVSLDTMDKPVSEGGTGGSTRVGTLRGLPTLSEGDESGVSVKGGRKNPFTGRVGGEGTGFVPAADTAVVRTRGLPEVGPSLSRHDAMAALSSAPAPTQTPRKVVNKAKPLSSKEAALAKEVKDSDLTNLASGGTRVRKAGSAVMYAAGTRVNHPEHGGGHVIGSDDTGLAVRFDSNPDKAVDVPHGEVSREENKNLRLPTRGQFAAKPIKETAEPREGVMDLGENTGKELK